MQNIDETEDGEISDDSGNDVRYFFHVHLPMHILPVVWFTLLD